MYLNPEEEGEGEGEEEGEEGEESAEEAGEEGEGEEAEEFDFSKELEETASFSQALSQASGGRKSSVVTDKLFL